ncbi:MAG TPA: hypothetical protein VJH03_04840 [Blastocatellia bacterium]|nr:hypothetical protein [Blastocatellia bacterium]
MSNQPPYGNMPPPAPGGKTKVLGLEYSVAGLLCYLPICCIHVIASIIWLSTEPKENRILRFHSLQSLLLTGVTIVIWVIFMFLGVGVSFAPSSAASAGGGLLISLVFWLILLIILILYIIGMVKGYQQQIWKIPVIGDIAEKNA